MPVAIENSLPAYMVSAMAYCTAFKTVNTLSSAEVMGSASKVFCASAESSAQVSAGSVSSPESAPSNALGSILYIQATSPSCEPLKMSAPVVALVNMYPDVPYKMLYAPGILMINIPKPIATSKLGSNSLYTAR